MNESQTNLDPHPFDHVDRLCVRVDPCTIGISCANYAHFNKAEDSYRHSNQTERTFHSKSISYVVHLHAPPNFHACTNNYATPHTLAGFHAYAKFRVGGLA